MTAQTMSGFNLNVARVDVFEHDKRGRSPLNVAVDGIKKHVERRAFDDAHVINRSRIYHAVADLFNGLIPELIAVCYQFDEYGMVNIDDVTGRILVGLPWGSKAHRGWDLRSTEADTLRALMLARQGRRGHVPLFFYDAEVRNWFLNFRDYGRRSQAMNYHQANFFGAGDVRRAWDEAIAKRNGTYIP